MIYLIHENNKVKEVLNHKLEVVNFDSQQSITETLFLLAHQFPDELIVWSHSSLKRHINVSAIPEVFHHKLILASYSVHSSYYINDAIGFVDQSVYIKVNRRVTYPTWLMSSDVGGIHASALLTVSSSLEQNKDFNYFLSSLAKLAMPQGLFCYSEPKLLIEGFARTGKAKTASTSAMFKFVRGHYKLRWVFILLYSYIFHKRQLPLISFFKSFFRKQVKKTFDFSHIDCISSKRIVNKKEVDVVIPTIGRKQYLFDVLKDLSVQTILPKNVILIEQNPDIQSESELDYLKEEKWPFKIKHKFIHQSGVCNARNLGLNMVESEWTFLGDDDNRFDKNLIKNIFTEIEKVGAKAISTVYLKPNEKQVYLKTTQTSVFAGGNSFVKSELLDRLKFDMAYEFNYGEDSDFGMQIRNLGEDVIFCANIRITHLKAPIGGYRIKVKHPWSKENIEPKPSPTIMLFNLRYFTSQQQLTYRLLLLLRFYKHQKRKNPIAYLKAMKKSWESSLKWANSLMEKSNA